MSQNDIEKINDVIDCIGKVHNLSPGACELLKNNIIARCNTYSDVASSIPANLVENKNCLFKPVNGYYSLVDFLLNRLVFNIREYDINSTSIGDKGHYSATEMKISLLPHNDMLNKVRNNLNIKISDSELERRIIKVFIHEIGHSLQTSFTDGYETGDYSVDASKIRTNNYLQLINLIGNYKNGKYSSQVIKSNELKPGKTRVLDYGLSISKTPRITDTPERKKLREIVGGGSLGKRYEELLEIFNEDEALKIANCMIPMGNMQLDGGNYRPVFNYDSSNYSITGYAPMLKRIIGKGRSFYSMYIDPIYFVEGLDLKYKDISHEVFSNDYPIVMNIQGLLQRIKNDKTPGVANTLYLKLDLFVVKCFEKRVDEYLENHDSLDETKYNVIMSELFEIERYVTRNNDLYKNNQLPHNIVISNIKKKLDSNYHMQKGNLIR